MFNSKPIITNTNENKWQTSSVSTNESVAPPFINQQNNQWPTWSKPTVQNSVPLFGSKQPKRNVKVNHMGFVQEPKYEGVVYEQVENIPFGNYIGRGPTRFYKYYIDPSNDAVYFYPFSGMMKIESEKIESKPVQSQLLKDYKFLRESVKVVPMAIFQAAQASLKTFAS